MGENTFVIAIWAGISSNDALSSPARTKRLLRLHETGTKSNRNDNWNCENVYMRPVRKSQNFQFIPLARQFPFLDGFC
jgi:hypothetical protein